jgi:hypothetical protein
MVLSVSGASMTSGILVTPPAGFEVSLTAGGTYSPTVTVGSGGTIASTPVYVRLAAATNAGTYSGNISLTASSANTITTAISNSVVSAATLTYTANTASRVYGAANPAFSGTVSGFVLNQTQASATTGTLTFTTTATVSSHAGQYPINGSGLTANNGNYTFVQATGNATALTIGQATPIVTVTGTTSFTYNGNQQGPSTASNTGTGTSYAFSYSGTGATTYGPSATEPVNAGSYTVTASVAASGDGNWTAASSAATAFTINTATLTITANNITKCNGATYTFAGTEFTTSGLVNGDGSSVNSVSLASAGAAAGAAPGTYSITPSAALGTGLSNYNITYTNGTLTVEAPITMTLTQVNPDCHGNPGSLTASAVTGGGVAPYTYKLNTGAFNPSGTYVSNPLFSSLSTGGYTYAVKDAYGCIGTQGAILSQLTKEPVLINNSTAPATVQVCYGAVTTITTNVVGGNPAFTYTLNSNGVNGTPQQSANRYFAVGAGSYYIIVTDSHTCSYNTDTIRVTQPSTALSLGSSVSTNIVNCTSSASTIILTAAGGYSSSYTYSDNNGSIYQASNSFAGLAPTVQTVYNLEVKDAMGCTAAGTATVQAVSEYILSSSALTGNTEACYGGTTTISTTPSGGTPPYMYSLDNGSYVSSSQRYFATVTPGSYTITVKDNAGCTYTPPAIVITQPSSALTFTVEATNANCLSITGSITIAAGGGYGGYSYSDNNGTSFQPSSSFTGLAAGTYNVVVKDMNGCTAYNTATVKEPTFTTSAIMGNLQVCYGATTSIYTVPSGGLTPYTYSLNGATVVTQAYRIFSVPAGNYYITVTDNEGCTATTPTVSVTQPPVPVELIAMQGGSVCTGDAGISVLALGGYGNYSYSDNGGSSYQSSNLFSNLGYGSYPIVVEDQNGCVSQTTVVKLTALTSSAIQGTLTVCPGGTTTIYTVPSGGAAPYSYRLDSSVYVPSNERYFNVPAGTHTIDVKDNASCTYTPPSVTVAMVSCTGLADGAADQKVETKAAFAAHVMPNPAQGAFHLQVESSSRENLELMVTNMQGVKVYEGRGGIDNTYEFGAAFTSGMYILQIRQGNEVHTVKLVKGN